ncbi:Rv1733c family protein [Phycicoccus ginsengisoli]
MTRQYRVLRAPAGTLVRGSDRVEAATRLAVLLVLAALVPVLVGLGLAVDRNLVAEAAQQRAGGHEVVAVLQEDTRPLVLDGAGEMVAVPVQVRARWELPGGGSREGLVPAARGLRAGAQVPTWLDHRGWPAPRPLSAARAAAISLLVAASGWMAAGGGLAVLALLVRRGLDRQRYRAWAREWSATAPGATGAGPSERP